MAELCATGMVTKVYTQNIDGLEAKAGIPQELLEQVHGTMDQAFCHTCKKPYTGLEKRAPGQVPRCDCGGLVRPSTVMFGEPIAVDMDRVAVELEDCDALFILGTSLAVPPINEIPLLVPHDCLRVYINLTAPPTGAGFNFSELQDMRDVFLQGPCDQVFPPLANRIGEMINH